MSGSCFACSGSMRERPGSRLKMDSLLRFHTSLLFLLLMVTIPADALAGGPFGPPRSLAGKGGGLHTAIGYWYDEDIYEGDTTFRMASHQLYSEAGYGGRLWDAYVRLGISDLEISDGFRSSTLSTTTDKRDFEENTDYTATAGAKAFYPFSELAGLGFFMQGSYWLRDATDEVGVINAGVPARSEVRVQNFWDIYGGFALEVSVWSAKFYLGPYLYYSEAKVSASEAVAGLPLTGADTLRKKSKYGGVAGLEAPLTRGFRVNIEGHYAERFSGGAAVTYSY